MTDCKELLPEIIKHSDAVKKITRPLHDHFQVSCFFYFNIDTSGNEVALSDLPEYEELYFSTRLFSVDPFARHPDNFKSGFVQMENFGSNEHKENLAYIFNKFDLASGISFIEKKSNSFDFFTFLGNKKTSSNFKQFTFTHINLLKEFTRHFKKETNSILLEMKKASYSMANLVGEEHFYANMPIDQTLEREKLRSFLVNMGYESEILKFDSLTKREREELQL